MAYLCINLIITLDDLPTGFFSKFITPTKTRNAINPISTPNVSQNRSRNNEVANSRTPRLEKQRKVMPAYMAQRNILCIEEQRSSYTRKKYQKRVIIIEQKHEHEKYTTAHFGENGDQGDRNNTIIENKEMESLDGNYLLFFLLCPRILKISINSSPKYEFMCKLVPSDTLYTQFIERYSFQWMELESLQVVL
jgi:hypothetical protein